nr:MAG TPA: hypothetical protein [Caudoviricetes sp.]
MSKGSNLRHKKSKYNGESHKKQDKTKAMALSFEKYSRVRDITGINTRDLDSLLGILEKHVNANELTPRQIAGVIKAMIASHGIGLSHGYQHGYRVGLEDDKPYW